MGGRGATSVSYQGTKFDKAHGEHSAFSSLPDIEKMISRSPKVAEDDEEALRQLRGLRSENDVLTIYRAAPADHINSNDWVFLSKSKANRLAHKTFNPGELKDGYKVLSAQVKASDVRWTGKNLEFAYTGKRKRGI